MKRIVAMLAVAGCMVSGCGPAEDAEDVGFEPSSTEQRLTPCLANCYPSCVGTTTQVNQCKAACRVECAGS
ncbi:hypothetical protein A176_006408 [Myxococcus hansupus]|uniref:Lipoprotein n=1 Tax=Pseudomyxococcus hansupus TaxID=1297742 RepID=A0A0H4X1H1_9BACT|nr:hypothetical protein [Myxococcus hansupus]AKQ69496.1 hypothetical protein A176_006408 [Myxococcus hansupus]